MTAKEMLMTPLKALEQAGHGSGMLDAEAAHARAIAVVMLTRLGVIASGSTGNPPLLGM